MNTPPKVLLIDDDSDDREIFIDAIRELDESINCKTISNAPDAISFLKDAGSEEAPDIIFLDLNMPRMDGKACLREIKQNSRFKDTPVIIYSTTNDAEEAEELMQLGANHFVTKPVHPEEVYYMVSLILSEEWVK